MSRKNRTRAAVITILSICLIFLAACDSTARALQDIKSSDVHICQNGVDAILLSGDDELIKNMKESVKNGEANTEAILDRLLTIQCDEALAEEFHGITDGLLYNIFYGNMGKKAYQILEDDPRNDIMFDSLFEFFSFEEEYNIEHFSKITNPAFIMKMLNYYTANYTYAGGSNAEINDLNEVFKESGPSDVHLDFWTDYYATNGLDRMDVGREALSNLFYNVSINPYDGMADCSILTVLYQAEFPWDEIDKNSQIDESKTVIIDVQNELDGGSCIAWSPYSFILIPQNNCVTSENLYNAGTVICIYRIMDYAGAYTGGVDAYTQSTIIIKIDRSQRTVTEVQTLEGSAVGNTIQVIEGQSRYVSPAPLEEDIILAIQQALQQ